MAKEERRRIEEEALKVDVKGKGRQQDEVDVDEIEDIEWDLQDEDLVRAAEEAEASATAYTLDVAPPSSPPQERADDPACDIADDQTGPALPFSASASNSKGVEMELALRRRNGWPTASAKPKQSYLVAKAAAEQAVHDHAEAALGSCHGEASSSPRPPAAPPVPLFSSSSKRQLQSLTSRSALKCDANPITKSLTGHGTMHYNSSSTGHQVANRVGTSGPADSGWWATRMRKLKDQQASLDGEKSEIFKGCNIYLNGYMGESIGNQDLIRALALHGARYDHLPNGTTTHIVSAMKLSGKKGQEQIRLKMGRAKKFVKVEWVLDSLKEGKRKPEHLYAHENETQRGIAGMLTASKGKASPSSVVAKTAIKGTSVGEKGSGDTKLPQARGTVEWREAAREAAATTTPPRGCS